MDQTQRQTPNPDNYFDLAGHLPVLRRVNLLLVSTPHHKLGQHAIACYVF